MSTLNLADGESFVKGRSTAKARELLELAGDEHKASVRTVSHGYIVPSAILPEGYGAITKADLPAVTTEPGTPTNVEDVWNKGGASKDPVGTPLAEADNADPASAVTTALGTDGSNTPDPAGEGDDTGEGDKGDEGQATPDGSGDDSGAVPDSDADANENPEGKEFDPSTATVDEVKEYLAGADDAERARVIAAEKESDKPRKGVLDLATTEEGK